MQEQHRDGHAGPIAKQPVPVTPIAIGTDLSAPSMPSIGGNCSDRQVKQKMALPVAAGRRWHRAAPRGELMLMAIDWKALCIALNVTLVS